MHIRHLLSFCLAFLLTATLAFGQNQTRERKASTPFLDRVWYGGNLGLGFAGGNTTSQFNFGLYPMAGYKLIPWFSVGPRLGFDYTYYKTTSTNNKIASTNIFSFYSGAFARAKVIRWLFIQGEYGVTFGKVPSLDGYGRLLVDANDKVIKDQVTQESGLVGLGYNSGGIFATEIMVLYDVLVPDNSYQSPWSYRFGFTYKF